MKLVICDNQRILAEALAAALGAYGHQVLAVTTTVADGLSAVSDGAPDVCLLELKLGDQLGGLDVTRSIHQRYPDTKVLVLSEVTDPETLTQVKSSGAAGIVNKDLSVDQIAAALDVIAAGGRVLDPGLLRVRSRGTARPDPGEPAGQAVAAGEGDRHPDRPRRKHQADVLRDERHGRNDSYVRKERAEQTRGAQPAAACRYGQPGQLPRRSGTGCGCSCSSGVSRTLGPAAGRGRERIVAQ